MVYDGSHPFGRIAAIRAPTDGGGAVTGGAGVVTGAGGAGAGDAGGGGVCADAARPRSRVSAATTTGWRRPAPGMG
jgi:hypothetical protein